MVPPGIESAQLSSNRGVTMSAVDRRDFLRMMGVGAAASTLPLGCSSAGPGAAPDNRPNIVVMMADDMGFSDVGCYGSEIPTLHIDRLAQGGIRFTQFYNTARCCPTRASLLTGLYPHQTGVGHMMGDYEIPGYRGDLNNSCLTIAEVLRGAGYTTLMSGKWHVTPVNDSHHNWPRQRGFDRFYGTIHGAGSFYDPVTLTRDDEPIDPGDDYYYTTAIGDNAADFIEQYGANDNPFFLYVPFTSPHWPLHVFEEDIARYKGRYDMGWDELRAQRHQRMIEMGLVEERWPMTSRDERVPAWKDAEHKEWQARRMEVYAAQIDVMDGAVGRVMSKLQELGIEENTLVLFLADNGGCAEELGPQGRGLHYPDRTYDGRPVQRGNDPSVMPGPEETYQSYGIPWANASNTPFRLYKHWVHEGGISTPLIAHWPAQIKHTGTLTHQPGHLIDVMATCVDLAEGEYPATYDRHTLTPLEGKSLAPVFRGEQREPHQAIYWEHEGNRAVRQQEWKLVSRYRPESGGIWELYDLEADRTETNDLAGKEPDKLAEMVGLYESWAERCNVVPWRSWEQS